MLPFVNIHTHRTVANELSIINLSYKKDPANNNCYSFGIHPWHVGKISENETLAILKSYCLNKKIVAVGEIGIDRAIKTPLEQQRKIFIKQLDIAKNFNMPIIIHSVKANADLLQIRKNQIKTTPWILHGFNGSIQDAKQFIDKNCFISFGAGLFTNKRLQSVMREIPLNRLFLETDDSETSISDIYKKASDVVELSILNLKKSIYSNFKQILKSNECQMVK